MKPHDDSKRNLDIIKKGGRILIKLQADSIWYLGSHTNIAAGPDGAYWVRKKEALPLFNLHWARTVAKLYNAKVVVSYPKQKQVPTVENKQDVKDNDFCLTPEEEISLSHLLYHGVGYNVLIRLDLLDLQERLLKRTCKKDSPDVQFTDITGITGIDENF